MNSPLSAPSAELIEVRETWARKYTHPLEVVVPFFRRFPKSLGRDLIYTFIWNSVLATFFTAVPAMFSGKLPSIGSWFANNLIVANCIGYLFHAAYFISDRTIDPWLRRQSGAVLAFYHLSLSVLCVMFGFVIAGLLLGWPVAEWISSRRYIVSMTVSSVLIAGIMGVIFYVAERRAVAEMQLQKERARVATIEREAMLAHLKALQAQIEPHFLFNTLANVVGLIHPQPDTAKLMLEKFIAYLRASLAATREQETTLGNDFQLMANFLAILQIRMGDRLRVELDLPDDLASQHLPSMLLQPLVENAIKHGLEPKIEGGCIALQARREGDALRVSVTDTGLGFSGATSSGLGLKNVRERIDKLFDGKASLTIEENYPCGTRVILIIPLGHSVANSSPGAARGVFSPEEVRRC